MRLKTVRINSFKGLASVELSGCNLINAIVGKNNSGKSSILHAIDMAGLALSIRQWDYFQPKLAVKDLFSDVGNFSIELAYEDDSTVKIMANPNYGPKFEPSRPDERQRFSSVLILPDVGAGMLSRHHKTPRDIITYVENRNYGQVNSLDILFAIKYYSLREERGFTEDSYRSIIDEIKYYFPDIEDVESDRTEQDIATLTYTELGRKLDILYSGTGLKHFLDVLIKTTVSKAKVVLLDEPELGLHPDLQRRFVEYVRRLAEKDTLQIFMATHSPVLPNYADTVTYYRIVNTRGNRLVLPVQSDAIHLLLSDLGIRPSDVFNKDICILVEGASEVIFFEHIIHQLYSEEFENLAVGIVQYGGGAAEGIVSGAIHVDNITPV